ncbi:3-oxoacyl-[acyl-carrier-protein] synthase-3 [Thermosporothrix hazakensis]|jgi:3-oxoacyl-[acyl-carrier-protein] synthase-3|uniref:3-oxoacyl-[acyl-carrier-protein] synthase-3 n=2 Tax=Thermosporothrix TaxID=768650 RepID=A0A326TYV4_THEHA|nr:3-oxoacyl-ACP synthase III family protein [Thermosporothrix hazakensis]PZW22530.1 3-oxoacyl-[acyl-carrier-protein] synthase-3 [Thermosporothrix hazakensis]BBH87786.1 3-oxoacyl-[acyl-carrier-protein] synthase 3 [Thermosporothrix sp. COM3]GCE50218.1 3-oxoacyl-[acyl-carrier-protein] synthase 3 [Thermosporothrix hazakensis]
MTVGILGTGYSVPPHIRTNDDPLFDQVKRVVNSKGIAEKDLFTGLRERRYLKDGEQLESLMLDAAQKALSQARVSPAEIDRIYGYASVSPYLTPNALYAIHRDLGLPQHTLVVPINSEFSNFLLSLIQAWEAILAGHCRYALIVCGTNWTRYMDYTQGHALSVGDGAGAVVLGPSTSFTLVDYATQTLSEQYGAMVMQTRPLLLNGRRYLPVDEQNVPLPTYEILLESGIHSFQTAGMEGPPFLIQQLLQKHGLTGENVALLTHQASRLMLDYWAQRIRPKEYLETLERFGNMTMATYPVNLAYFFHQITAEYVVLAAVGVGFHQTTVLLKR